MAAAMPEAIRTMEEFALAIGLSRQTVSRYFGNPDAVRGRTRRIIEDGIHRYGYRPNFYASNLTRRRPRAVGIIVPSIIDPFFSELVSTIELHMESRGYLTVLQCSHNDRDMELRALSRLVAMDVTAIAMAPLGVRSDIAAIETAMKQTAILFMDSRLREGIPYIGNDNAQSVSAMVDYLCRSGSPPALFTMPPVNVNVLERREAFVRRMTELGHVPRILNADDTLIDDDYERYGYERFLSLPPDRLEGVDTILCPNDRVAVGILAAARRLGLKVGGERGSDLRVASHDGQRFGAFASPPLTTSAQNIRGIGDLVANVLLSLGDGGSLPESDILLQGTLIFRDSA